MNESITITARHGQTYPRTEFGYERTVCACPECVNNCRHIPGYLVPDDLGRISRHLGFTNLSQFAFEYLLASPGATVISNDQIFQIPTVVPRRKEDGSCIFLDEDSRCRIHNVSPFGCAFFDTHQSDGEANERSAHGLAEVARHWAESARSDAYTVIWRLLNAAGQRAIPAHIARRRLVS